MKLNLMQAMASAMFFMLLGASVSPGQPPAPQFAPAELDQMLAPIALYPDPLLSQVLMAATYPVEVVDADRWLQVPANAALTGAQLAAALAPLSWDPSVKSLVPFPQVLRMMDGNLDWTEQLGDAFLADQAAVMDSVQRLRQRAMAAGKCGSTPQQVVTTEGSDVTIEPVNPATVYVPVYDPNVVYGVWPYVFPPYYFPGYFGAVAIGDFGYGWFGVPIVAPLWGWNHWDWRQHRINVDPGRFAALNHGRPPAGGVTWQHDPAHRDGVPYRDAATRARFQGAASPQAERGFRGYPAGPEVASRTTLPVVRTPQAFRPEAARSFRPSPMIESFGRGADVRAQAMRGQASRIQMRAAPSRSFAPSFAARGGFGRR